MTVVSIVVFRGWVIANRDSLTQGIRGYYGCLYAGFGPDGCASYIDHLQAFLYWAVIFWVSTQGFWLFLVFGVLNAYNRKLWVLVYRNHQEGRPLFYLPTGASGASGSGASGASGASSTSSVGDETKQQRRENRRFRRDMKQDKPDV